MRLGTNISFLLSATYFLLGGPFGLPRNMYMFIIKLRVQMQKPLRFLLFIITYYYVI